MPRPKRKQKLIACYVRVSTVSQNEEGQRAAIERWLDGNGINAKHVRWFADKQTGDNTNRPAFKKLQAAIFNGDIAFYLVIGAIRLMLYVVRKLSLSRHAHPARLGLAGARVMIGMALPLAWVFDPVGPLWVPLACVFVGELIDRAEFYDELVVSTPHRQAVSDLRAMVTGRAAV